MESIVLVPLRPRECRADRPAGLRRTFERRLKLRSASSGYDRTSARGRGSLVDRGILCHRRNPSHASSLRREPGDATEIHHSFLASNGSPGGPLRRAPSRTGARCRPNEASRAELDAVYERSATPGIDGLPHLPAKSSRRRGRLRPSPDVFLARLKGTAAELDSITFQRDNPIFLFDSDAKSDRRIRPSTVGLRCYCGVPLTERAPCDPRPRT